MKKPLLIGIGNAFRGDDLVGIEVGRSLEKRLGSAIDVTFCDGDTIDLMEQWKGRDSVFLVDAISSGEKEVGFVHQFDPRREKIPAVFTQTSTHLLDVAAVIELAQTLNVLPESCVLYGIEAKDFSLEEGFSEIMKKSLETITNTIEEDIRKKLCMN